jgi:rSAM/selenodomain-associated transferase 2/rSAM/selenodomain-associated transferase 1
MRASIIIPALDEAKGISATLVPLQPLRALGHEVIVVDGGSDDATVALARPLADRVLAAARGRARQMNGGAAVATGDVLLFLHADSIASPEGIEAMLREMTRCDRRWGRFDIAIASRSHSLKLVAAMMNARSRLTGIATGDQGIFVERTLFAALGGYADQRLMEDVELSARLKRVAGRPLRITHRIVTSGRRWDRNGPWRTIVAMWQLRLRYWYGADPDRLAKSYAMIADTDHPLRAPTLLVFVKEPAPGDVKTRLARTLGGERAASVHRELAERTLAMAAAARAEGIVGRVEMWCAPDAQRPTFAEWRDRYDVELATQMGADLGARMCHALDAALNRGAPALLIGTDCPSLDAKCLAQAAATLADHDAVFVPAEDGGYVLVGLARPLDAFNGIAWSTAGVMAATRTRLIGERATWRELPALWDVDLPQDLARWEALQTQPGNAGALTGD